MLTPPPSSRLCLPILATARTERESFGDRVGNIAAKLGTPLMPWQQIVAQVAGEVNPKNGRPAYREVICTVPRQSGKTTLLLGFELERALLRGKPQRIAYSAQTGLDARLKLLEDQVPLIEASPIWGLVSRVNRAQGSESIVFKNKSRISLQATSRDSGHGRSVDFGVVDEAFADDDERREQSILPAMNTKADGQMFVFSTAGDESSTYLRRKVEAGRAAVLAGKTSGIAYFEWSAGVDADPDDEEVWWRCMPALAGGVIDIDIVRHARQTMEDGEFRRAYLNQWTVTDERVIPEAVWRAVCVPDLPKPEGGLVLGVDADTERTVAAIVAADRQGRVSLVEHGPGVSWVTDRVVEVAKANSAEVVVDLSGPLGGLFEILKGRRVKVYGMQPREVAYATGAMYDLTADAKIRVLSSSSFDRAVAGAQRRPVGDGWVWGRRTSDVDISPLVALTLAVARAVRKRVSAYAEEAS